MAILTNEQLLTAARVDAGAFEEFYRRNGGIVLRFAARRSSSPGEVVDLVATVWLQVVASIDRFDAAKGSATGWLLGIAAHLCASEARRRGAEAAAMNRLAGHRLLDESDYERLEAVLSAASVAKDILAAISELPSAEREVAELVLVEGLTPTEAAVALDVTAAATRMRLARARRRVRVAVPEAKAAWNEEVV